MAVENFITGDSFIIGDEVTAAIENEPAFKDFDRFYVMRRVPMHDCDALLNQVMSKQDLFTRNFVAPVATPVDRRDYQIARLLLRPHFVARSCRGWFRQIVQ